jgi:hypothetical protein
VLATLTLTGPTSSGSAEWNGSGLPAYTGDSFALDFSAVYQPITPSYMGNPTPFQECEGPGEVCEFHLSWSESGGELDAISIDVNAVNDSFGYGGRVPFGLSGGLIASDYTYIGAGGTFASCDYDTCLISGFWQDAPSGVSEPSTLGLLGLALGWLGFIRVRCRK